MNLYWHSSHCDTPDEKIDPETGYELGDCEPCCMCDIEECIAKVIPESEAKIPN